MNDVIIHTRQFTYRSISPFIVCNCNHRIAKNNRIGWFFFMQTLPDQNKKPFYFFIYCIWFQQKNYKPGASLHEFLQLNFHNFIRNREDDLATSMKGKEMISISHCVIKLYAFSTKYLAESFFMWHSYCINNSFLFRKRNPLLWKKKKRYLTN